MRRATFARRVSDISKKSAHAHSNTRQRSKAPCGAVAETSATDLNHHLNDLPGGSVAPLFTNCFGPELTELRIMVRFQHGIPAFVSATARQANFKLGIQSRIINR